MISSKKVYLTKEGLKKFKKKYKELTKIQRPHLVERMARARDMGDLSENSDYQDARDKLRFLDDRIAELQKALSMAVVVKKEENPQKVSLGCKVLVESGGQKQVFVLVNELEADPGDKKISSQSPLGRLLLGKRVGDQVEIKTPAGKMVYKIDKIE